MNSYKYKPLCSYIALRLEATFPNDMGRLSLKELKKIQKKRALLNRIILAASDKFNLPVKVVVQKVTSKFWTDNKKWNASQHLHKSKSPDNDYEQLGKFIIDTIVSMANNMKTSIKRPKLTSNGTRIHSVNRVNTATQ